MIVLNQMQVFSSKVLPFLSFFCLSFFRSYLGISFHLANLSACTSGVGVVFVHSTLPQRFLQPHFFAQKIPPLLFLSLLSPFFLQSRSIRRQMHFFASFSAAALLPNPIARTGFEPPTLVQIAFL